jgi:Cullin family
MYLVDSADPHRTSCLHRRQPLLSAGLQAFYDNRTKNRRLAWIYSLGSATIKGNFDGRPVEMLCSTSFHPAVLLQFNDSAHLTT